MNYRKTYQVKGKIIKKTEIQDLVEDVISKTKTSKDSSKQIMIEVAFKDGTTIKDKNIKLLDHQFFSTKKIEKIMINIGERNYDNIFRLYFSNDGFIEINSDNQVLFDSLCHTVENALNNFKKQNIIYIIADKLYGIIILFISFYIVSIVLIYSVCKILNLDISIEITCSIILMMGCIFPPFIMKWIDNNYPPINYDFGTDSINGHKKDRKMVTAIMIYVFTNIMLPVIINYFFNKK